SDSCSLNLVKESIRLFTKQSYRRPLGRGVISALATGDAVVDGLKSPEQRPQLSWGGRREPDSSVGRPPLPDPASGSVCPEHREDRS
ncbi:hypothetical protein P7K49_026532, partial [Saguinus oedipus]